MGDIPQQNIEAPSSDSITDTLEGIEEKLSLPLESKKASNDIRLMYFKVKSAIRNDSDNKPLQEAYDDILREYDNVGEEINSMEEYADMQKELLSDLSQLETVDGEKLVGTKIDASYFDVAIAAVDGALEAGKQIYKNMKEMLDFLDPAMFATLWELLKNSKLFDDPMEFINDLYTAVKAAGGEFINDIERDYKIISQNSTGAGETAMNVELGLTIGLPQVFEFLNPLKFLHVFKFMNMIIPGDVISAIKNGAKTVTDSAKNIIPQPYAMTPDGTRIEINQIDNNQNMMSNEEIEKKVRERAQVDPTLWRMPEGHQQIGSPEVRKTAEEVQQQVQKILDRNTSDLEYLDNAGNIQSLGITEKLIRKIAGIKDPKERKIVLKSMMDLEPEQLNAVIKAHELGGDVFELGHGSIKKKMLIMKEAGMTKEEIKKVMDLGFAGNDGFDIPFHPGKARNGISQTGFDDMREQLIGQKTDMNEWFFDEIPNMEMSDDAIQGFIEVTLKALSDKNISDTQWLQSVLSIENMHKIDPNDLGDLFENFIPGTGLDKVVKSATDTKQWDKLVTQAQTSADNTATLAANKLKSVEFSQVLEKLKGGLDKFVTTADYRIGGNLVQTKDLQKLTDTVTDFFSDASNKVVHSKKLVDDILKISPFNELNKDAFSKLLTDVSKSVDIPNMKEIAETVTHKYTDDYFTGTLGFDNKVIQVVKEAVDIISTKFGKIDIDDITGRLKNSEKVNIFVKGDGALVQLVQLPDGRYRNMSLKPKQCQPGNLDDVLERTQKFYNDKNRTTETLFEYAT